MLENKRYKSVSYLNPGEITEEHFHLLMDISSIRGKKITCALRAFFVEGMARNDICSKYDIDPGNLSRKIEALQMLSQSIMALYPYYLSYSSLKMS